jgi:hypothetical protein
MYTNGKSSGKNLKKMKGELGSLPKIKAMTHKYI